MYHRIALALLIPLLIPVSARAQDVRRETPRGWGAVVRSFARAAKQAGRSDWPSAREGRPGTCVQITFDPRNADVTLVAPAAHGTGRLLEQARRLAAALKLPEADFILVQGRRTAIVDIELNDYIQRRRLASRFDMDLSALAAALARSELPRPAVIGVEAREGAAIVLGGAPRSLKDAAWFGAPGEVPSGSRLTYELGVSWRVIPGLLLIGIGPLAGAVSLLLAARRPPPPPVPVTPEEVQRRYDRQAPVWFSLLAPVAAVSVLMLAFIAAGTRRFFDEIELLLPGGAIGLTVPIAAWMIVLVIAFRRLLSQSKTVEPAASGTAPAADEDVPPVWTCLHPLNVMCLGLLGPVVFLLIPVYDWRALFWMRAGMLGWIGLAFLGAAVLAWLGHRAGRTELKGGPWFDMVTTMAAEAKVRVRHVVLIRSQDANACATIWGTVGLSTSLIRNMDPAEVRAVVAHELAHLKLRHPQRTLALSLGASGLLWTSLWGLGSTLLPAGAGELRAVLFALFMVLLVPVLQMLVLGRGMRAREVQADRLAVEWTGDPDLVIRALERLHSLGLGPGRLKASDEALSTHPSLVHRIEAIRRREPPGRPGGADGSG